MASSSRRFLSPQDIARSVDEPLTDSESSVFDSDDESSVIDDLPVREFLTCDESENEYNDGEQSGSSLPSVARPTAFTWENMDNYVGQREQFVGNCGPQNEVKSVTESVNVFKLFFTHELISLIVRETNRYAEQCINSRSLPIPFRSRMREWKPLSDDEMYVVLALFMLIGIVQKPTLRSYFSKNSLLATPVFGSVISMDRFESVCKFIHFTNNDSKDTYQGPPKLFKIYPVISYLNKKFQNLYIPGQNISIDESLTLWKGRLSFKQYIPLKSSKFGIKTYELCESNSGYLWSFIIYTGKDTVFTSSLISEDTNKASAIVLSLAEPLLGRGHTLWMDNFYNAPALARILKSLKTDCVGTLRINRKDVPLAVKDKKLKKGELIAQHSGPVSVLKWSDKKNVTMISTYHGDDTQKVKTKGGQEREKPASVLDYNKNMIGVDLKDQLLQNYLLERKKMTKC
ncbi:piggyBac transposable element-derived protein 4-like [Zootermopsis nevadensis]|uniref:piggyBac transposable element-derived protein 4-like n=1 Tax=Zootermopsis nevadensis TaxID=136037 RepID=UPI000B8E6323|nr:piggyBac transposable element-derived protein 4-like [Zootermopsis nevadensis]